MSLYRVIDRGAHVGIGGLLCWEDNLGEGQDLGTGTTKHQRMVGQGGSR